MQGSKTASIPSCLSLDVLITTLMRVICTTHPHLHAGLFGSSLIQQEIELCRERLEEVDAETRHLKGSLAEAEARAHQQKVCLLARLSITHLSCGGDKRFGLPRRVKQFLRIFIRSLRTLLEMIKICAAMCTLP